MRLVFLVVVVVPPTSPSIMVCEAINAASMRLRYNNETRSRGNKFDDDDDDDDPSIPILVLPVIPSDIPPPPPRRMEVSNMSCASNSRRLFVDVSWSFSRSCLHAD